MALQELKDIYAAYEEKLGKVIAAASAFAGAFNLGDDPRNHACNEVFYEGVESWAAECAAGKPTPEEAREAVQWILEAPGTDREKPTFWYTFAAQKHAIALIPFLQPEDAQQLHARFAERYPASVWLPVQQSVSKALQLQAHNQIASVESAKGVRAFLSKLLKKQPRFKNDDIKH